MSLNEGVDFNFGKLLIVNKFSTTGKVKIKRLTESKKAVELKDKENASEEIQFLHVTLALGLSFIGIEQASFKIYQLDNNAVSTAYILADKSFVRAITMDDVKYEKIASANRAVAIVNRIRWQLGSIEQTYEQYQGDEISEHFKTDE